MTLYALHYRYPDYEADTYFMGVYTSKKAAEDYIAAEIALMEAWYVETERKFDKQDHLVGYTITEVDVDVKDRINLTEPGKD